MTEDKDGRAFERARDLGAQARRNGQTREQCPYRVGTSSKHYYAWHDGWVIEDMQRRKKD